jgi:lipopolysaccharide export LptBFGC system permease protein LptF
VILRSYIMRQLVIALTFSVAGMFFIALPGIAVAAVHKLPDTDMVILLNFLPLLLQNLAPYVLPIGFLLSVVATYGRLAADKEWTAIQMAGMQPAKMLLPALWLGLILSCVTFWMVSTVLPTLKQREKEFQIETASRAVTNIAPGRTELHLGDFHLIAAYRDDDGAFREAHISLPARPGQGGIKAIADKARLDIVDESVLVITLDDTQSFDSEAGWTSQTERLVVRVPLEENMGRSNESYRSPRYKTSKQLKVMLASGELSEQERNPVIYELHHRYAMSVVYLMFLALGAPTGLIMRHGTQLGALAISVGYALLYYIISMRLGKQLGRSGVVDPALGAWSTVAIGLFASLFLLRKAMRR